MSNLIPNRVLRAIPDSPRVCLPYGLDLLDLARWFRSHNKAIQTFTIVSGVQELIWEGSDVIDLFNTIQSQCINYKLAESFIVSMKDNSLYFFDMHERFSFFSAKKDLIDRIFPFCREIMWENFALLQEDDIDLSLKETFDMIHSN